MSTPGYSKPPWRIKGWHIVVLVAIALGIVGQFSGGNSGSNSGGSSTGVSTASSDGDIMTRSSCRDWYVVISEGAKGIMTDAELRTGMQKVYDKARYSVDVDIVDAATRQLAAVTAGDTEAYRIAATAFGNACKAHGQ